MNVRKALPVLLLILLAVFTVVLKRSHHSFNTTNRPDYRANNRGPFTNPEDVTANLPFDRKTNHLYFTKHARCRMQCRHISEQEVKDILAKGKVNYRKSNLDDTRGATYAIEGVTTDQQHVRIIFAPKQKQVTVVTVIDLEVEYSCNCS